MCINRKNETLINENIIFETRVEERHFPTLLTNDEYLVGCDTCFYPIARYADIQELLVTRHAREIYIGLVINVENLFTNISAIRTGNWQRQIFCYCCAKLLSFTAVEVPPVIRSFNAVSNIAVINYKSLIITKTQVLREYFEV